MSGVGRTLDNLERLGLLTSWEEYGEFTRGVPRRMYGLTWDGAKVLERQKLFLLMAQSLALPD